jgi:hypothetical protein
MLSHEDNELVESYRSTMKLRSGNKLGQAVNALQTGSGTSLAVENIPAMHDPTQPASASECEIA